MTAYAYAQAAQVPHLKALEISVCQTADRVLVCSHDPTTQRVTGVPYVIADETWSTLSTLMVTAKATSDPGQPARAFTRFDEVVESYLDRFVLFVEPKSPGTADRLMSTMAELGQPERVVWKQPVNSRRFHIAKSHGFSTWGYVLNDPAHRGGRLVRYAASEHVDMLGAPKSESDAFVSAVVAQANQNDKLTIMWVISRAQDRSRALRLGCAGLMTSRLTEVPPGP